MRFTSVKQKDADKKTKLKEVIESIKNGDNVYILIHNLNCPPCKATYPEWMKLESQLSNKYPAKNNILVADVEDTLIDEVKPYVGDIDGVPTMKLIKDNGRTKQPYESSNISKNDRSLESFIEWIENNELKQKQKEKEKQSSSPQELLERLSISNKKRMTGGRRRQRKTKTKNRTRKTKKSKSKKSKSRKHKRK